MRQIYQTPASEALELAPASGCLLDTSVQSDGNPADMPIVEGPGGLWGAPADY